MTIEYDVVNTGTAFTTSNLIKWTYNDRSEVTDAEKYNSTDPDNPANAVTSYDYALAFDNIGNRSSYNTSTGGTATTYTVNNLNQYTATANPSQSLTYDNDGGMLTDGTGWNNTWNGENRLIETYNDTVGKKLEFVYDYKGRRVEKKVYTGTSGTSWTLTTHERFVYDGYKCIEVLDGANSNAILQKFLWNGEEILSVYDTAATATYYYFADANKNICQLMDSSGNTVAKYEYSPFGVQTLATGTYATTNLFRFSSEYFDTESSLVYYNYRYYRPDIGRWLSRDPIEEEGGYNLYGFIDNNPVDLWDELGLAKCPECDGDKYKPTWENIKRALKKLFSSMSPENGIDNLKKSLDNTVRPIAEADKAAQDILDTRYSPLEMLDQTIISMYGAGILTPALRALGYAGEYYSARTATIFSKVKGPQYGPLKDSKFVGAGKKFTQSQKANIRRQNMINNNGELRSDISGKKLTVPKQSSSGVTPPGNEAHIDHIVPKSQGGSNSYSNAQVISRAENLRKGAN